MQQRSFIVEGNIGAGKSTFLKMLNQHLDVHIVLEPHEKWQSVGGTENLLAAFYNDPNRWAYTFQTYAFVTRILQQEEHALAYPNAIHILERSVYSDRYCFAKNAFELGVMNALEWKLYQEWFSWLNEKYVSRPAGFIYLRTDPEVCYQRLTKRGRHEETTVSKDYLMRLHQKHEAWLVAKEGVAKHIESVPVLILASNNDFQDSKEEQERHVAAVLDFIATTAMVVPSQEKQQLSTSL